jgi:hypothetical protein
METEEELIQKAVVLLNAKLLGVVARHWPLSGDKLSDPQRWARQDLNLGPTDYRFCEGDFTHGRFVNWSSDVNVDGLGHGFEEWGHMSMPIVVVRKSEHPISDRERQNKLPKQYPVNSRRRDINAHRNSDSKVQSATEEHYSHPKKPRMNSFKKNEATKHTAPMQKMTRGRTLVRESETTGPPP